MGFIDVKLLPPENHPCLKPSSRAGTLFAPGTTWRCDGCGCGWEYQGGSRKDILWEDLWKRRPELDGPDNRARLVEVIA